MRTHHDPSRSPARRRPGLGPTALVALAALALAAGVGCATQGNGGDLEERVTRLEDRVTEAERKLEDTRERVTEVEDTAQTALRRAENAEAAARSASEDADESARKAERMFEKSVSK